MKKMAMIRSWKQIVIPLVITPLLLTPRLFKPRLFKPRLFSPQIVKQLSPALICLIATACGTTSPMQIVQQRLAQDKLVPQAAIAPVDNFLNHYQFATDVSTTDAMRIAIHPERNSMLANGDQMLVQVLITSPAPRVQNSQLHLLVYNGDEASPASLQEQDKLLHSILKARAGISQWQSVTVDYYQEPETKQRSTMTRLLSEYKTGGLSHFLSRVSRLQLASGNHHFLLLSNELSQTSDLDKRNCIDIGRILKVKNHSLSVFSVAEQPDMGFLAQLSQAGQGRLELVTNQFSAPDSLRSELSHLHAKSYTKVRLRLSSGGGPQIRAVLSPSNAHYKQTNLRYNIDTLAQGQHYVLLLQLASPDSGGLIGAGSLKAELEYLDPNDQRHHRQKHNTSIRLVADPDLIDQEINRNVKKAQLIIQTQQVLTDIVPYIQDKRYYRAISMLLKQELELREFTSSQNHCDPELIRDADILQQYSNKLYAFDESWFQTLKIYAQLGWDNQDYQQRY